MSPYFLFTFDRRKLKLSLLCEFKFQTNSLSFLTQCRVPSRFVIIAILHAKCQISISIVFIIKWKLPWKCFFTIFSCSMLTLFHFFELGSLLKSENRRIIPFKNLFWNPEKQRSTKTASREIFSSLHWRKVGGAWEHKILCENINPYFTEHHIAATCADSLREILDCSLIRHGKNGGDFHSLMEIFLRMQVLYCL